jgi:hypothetical protein
MLGNNASFMEGVLAIRMLECDDRFISAFLASVLELAEATKQDKDGGVPLFIRSCAQERSREDCGCIARVGKTVIEGIYEEAYSREVFPRIISRNPLLGMRLAAECRVTNY